MTNPTFASILNTPFLPCFKPHVKGLLKGTANSRRDGTKSQETWYDALGRQPPQTTRRAGAHPFDTSLAIGIDYVHRFNGVAVRRFNGVAVGGSSFNGLEFHGQVGDGVVAVGCSYFNGLELRGQVGNGVVASGCSPFDGFVHYSQVGEREPDEEEDGK